MKLLKKISALFIFLLMSAACFAQTNPAVKTSLMRRDGRIYVVIAVMLTILIGLILYIIRLDRKISRLEKGN
ncbi:MAG: CcmD family protein [Chitinophagaceae bacterium]|nr:CcmD family protein [Chitinophagaceae bacterium]